MEVALSIVGATTNDKRSSHAMTETTEDLDSDTLDRLRLAPEPALALARLVEAGADDLPLPGRGRTLARWRALAEVAAHDLSLVKLYEGHTDALAILAELGGPAAPAGSCWGTWCAEPPDARVAMHTEPGGHGTVRLDGRKAWCSGAAGLTHAIVSTHDDQDRPCLAAVTLDQPGVRVTDEGWQAVGMAASASVDVVFDGALGVAVGLPGDYVRRAGFWHGGAGIAACWYGGALGIAREALARSGAGGPGGRAPDPHRLAHLGAVDAALAGAAAVLHRAAEWIDRHPAGDAHRIALNARLVVEQAAETVLRHAGRALGAGPLCRDGRFARAMADLPVYLRQSHAERDLAALGRHAIDERTPTWTL